MAVTAEYLPTVSDQRNPSDYTPELSRRARGVEVWAALRSLGRAGLADLIERTCRHAGRFAEGLAAAGQLTGLTRPRDLVLAVPICPKQVIRRPVWSLTKVRIHVLPHHLAVRGHLEQAAEHRLADEGIPVG